MCGRRKTLCAYYLYKPLCNVSQVSLRHDRQQPPYHPQRTDLSTCGPIKTLEQIELSDGTPNSPDDTPHDPPRTISIASLHPNTMFLNTLDIRARMKLREPMEDSIKRAHVILHIQDLVAGGKLYFTKHVLPELRDACSFAISGKTGNGFASFDAWRKNARSSARLFPAALIFTAAAHKNKLIGFLNVQKQLVQAIQDQKEQMAYCTRNIDVCNKSF